jgi:hypothetical protein
LVEVVYLKKSQKKQFRLSFINVDRLSYNELILKVAEKVLDYLNKNPIASKLDDKDGAEQNGGDIFTLTVKIKNFEDWRNLKTTLENSNLVDEIIIESFAKDQVIFDIKYNSKITLEEALSSLGVKYAKSGDKSYEIQLNNNAN